MVNHATEDLQHRVLDYSKYCSLYCHVKMERTREREERLRWQREQYRARKERNRRTTAIQVGNMEGI